MSGIKFSNNAATTVVSTSGQGSTSITVTDGSVFPAASTGDYFFVTVTDVTNGDVEIVKVTHRATNVLTVVRAQEGTSQITLGTGDTIELRLTAGTLELLRDQIFNADGTEKWIRTDDGDVTLEKSTGGALRLLRDDGYIISSEVLGTITFAGTVAGSSEYGAQIIGKAAATHNSSLDYASTQLEFWTRMLTTNKQALVLTYTGKLKAPLTYAATVSYSPRDLHIDYYGNIGYVSSIRASKTNIEALDDVEWLYDLAPVSFNYKQFEEPDPEDPEILGGYLDSYYDEVNYGLIAEDVELVNDSICDYDVDDDGNKTLAGIGYKRLVTPLVKAIQNQKKLIDELTARLEALENS